MENGFHEIYVNTKINDGSDIAELMGFFEDSTGYHDKFPNLSNRVRLFKVTEEGVTYMSSVIENYISDVKEESRREGSYTSVQKLVANRAAATEKKACEMLSVDYDAFLKWKNEQ